MPPYPVSHTSSQLSKVNSVTSPAALALGGTNGSFGSCSIHGLGTQLPRPQKNLPTRVHRHTSAFSMLCVSSWSSNSSQCILPFVVKPMAIFRSAYPARQSPTSAAPLQYFPLGHGTQISVASGSEAGTEPRGQRPGSALPSGHTCGSRIHSQSILCQ